MFNPTTVNDVLTPTPVLDMPTVLRSVYSRFAVQQALSDKLDFESAGEDPDVVTDSPADRRPEVDV